MPETGNVDLWLVSLEDAGGVPVESVLSTDEEARAARFRFERDRAHWVRARSALRNILAGCTGRAAGDIPFVTGPHGKPRIEDSGGIEFNLSHAGEWAIVAVTREVPVGVDIERIRETVDIAALLRRIGETDLPQTRPDLYQRWTRREAMVKAAGGALMNLPPGDFRVCNLSVPKGYSGALALIGHDPLVRYKQLLVRPDGTETGSTPAPI